MGAWGEGVYQNDQALDFLDNIGVPDKNRESSFIVQIIDMVNPLYPEELRVVCDQFVQLHPEMFKHTYADVDWLDRTKNELIDKLAELTYSDWMDEWLDYDLILSQIIEEVHALVMLPDQNK